MSLKRLTSLELHSYLPPVHYLRGLPHLQHLLIAAGTASLADALIMAAVAALDAAATALTSLRLQVGGCSVPFMPASTTLRSLEGGLEERQRDREQHQQQQQQHNEGLKVGDGKIYRDAGVAGGGYWAWRRGGGDDDGDGNATTSGSIGSSTSSSSSRGCGRWAERKPGCATWGSRHATQGARLSRPPPLLPAAPRPPAAASAALPPAALRVFECSGGYLRHLPASVKALTSLHALLLSHNCLRASDVGCLGLMTQLTRLDLTKNLLLELPLSWGSLKGLRVLELGGNVLGEWPGEALGGAGGNLERLVLKGNQLLVLPEGVTSLGRLSYLDLSSNKLQVRE
jgi:Leucine-rich repeat (LRR) protein